MDNIKPFIRIKGHRQEEYLAYKNRIDGLMDITGLSSAASDFRIMPSGMMELSDEDLSWMIAIAFLQMNENKSYEEHFTNEHVLEYIPFCGEFVFKNDAAEPTAEELVAFVKSHKTRCEELWGHRAAVRMTDTAKRFQLLIV